MRRILVINARNCAEDYVSTARLCDAIRLSDDKQEALDCLQNSVFIYEAEKEESTEKIFSNIALKLKQGTLIKFDAEGLAAMQLGEVFLRVEHEAEDATTEYIYLDALLHKFPQMFCLLYTNETDKKYAIWNKAAEFFYGLSIRSRGGAKRIYGEYCDRQEGIWYVRMLNPAFNVAEHAKVNPVIELDEQQRELRLWKCSIGELMNNGEVMAKSILKRCRANFVESYQSKSAKLTKYYRDLYDGEEFQKKIKDVPLLTFYLFCMQVYYLKGGRELDWNHIKRIFLYAWDISEGVLQLLENIHHSTEKTGFMSIRVHENMPGKDYLSQRFGVEEKDYSFYFEIRILDLSAQSIVESFREKWIGMSGVEDMSLAYFFQSGQTAQMKNFWKNFNNPKENLVHHYGLQIFSSIVSANGGIFKVISSSEYHYDTEKNTYANGGNWGKGDSGQVHMPGTEYIILIPFRDREEAITTAVESNIRYRYDREDKYSVNAYCPSGTAHQEDGKITDLQTRKEHTVNWLATELYDWILEQNQFSANKKLVVLLQAGELTQYSLEIYCKAILLCGIYLKEKGQKPLHCILDCCTGNQMLEIARIFAIFYCKAYLAEYLSDMQIYLVDEGGELLITGSNLNSMYTITSKIMLVKGVNREIADIMKYLLGQYGAPEIFEEEEPEVCLVPFDMLELPGRKGTLFERNVRKVLDTDIQKHSLGCKISSTHMRAGSKIHIDSFFEAELLFHNDYYISRFAELILRRLPFQEDKRLILVGYEAYSELLLYKIVTELHKRGMIDSQYMIYEQRTGGKFRYMKSDNLERENELQFAIIIPINSTLTTHNKVRAALKEELERKGFQEDRWGIIANYALILIRSGNGPQLDSVESEYWEGIEGNKIKTHLIPLKDPDVEFFVCVNTQWYAPLKCPICFPKESVMERPLIETDRASIVPVQMLGIMEPQLLRRKTADRSPENLERVKALKQSLVYRHVIRNGNHYLYYFCLEKYFVQERERIIVWLKEERRKRVEITDRAVYDIIVSPLHYSNAGFLAEVNYYLFDNAALVLNFELEKEFRENVKTKYSNILGLYYNLISMGKKALIRFHFVDDTVVSQKTYTRAKALFQTLLQPPEGKETEVEVTVFSEVVLLLNRMSDESISNVMDGRLNDFHAYVRLNIPSMRNHEDACTECKLVSHYSNMRRQSSTNQQYQYWTNQIARHEAKEIQNKLPEEFTESLEMKQERAFRRMYCTHLTNERLGELGYEKNDTEKVRKLMTELMEEKNEDQVEWIISYVKIFSRPFISFRKSNREAIFQIMLLMIEYITKQLYCKKVRIVENYVQIQGICKVIRTQIKKSRDEIFRLLLILMKRLSDLGSNYIIRKDNICCILEVADRLADGDKEKQEQFRAAYLGIVKRICCQSSDESKSMFLEQLLIFGEEYGTINSDKEETGEPGEKLKLELLHSQENFIREIFLENTRVLNDGIGNMVNDFGMDFFDERRKTQVWDKLGTEYYYNNFKRLLQLYKFWTAQDNSLTDKGKKRILSMVTLYHFLNEEDKKIALSQFLNEEDNKSDKADAEKYYEKILKLFETLTDAAACYLLYGMSDEEGQYYRMQSSGGIENLSLTEKLPGSDTLVADTYILSNAVNDEGVDRKRILVKYPVDQDNVYLLLNYPMECTELDMLIGLKLLMAFHDRLQHHLGQDFSNNMLQKWSSREYFNKQMRLERATDHTDRDNLLKYYKQIKGLHQNASDLKQNRTERDRALFHMVINSYIARMNIQLLAEADPEREISKVSFADVYAQELKILLDSLHVVESFIILDENRRECFSQSLLERRVRLRKTDIGESLSFRRISVIVVELVLSAINHWGKKGMAEVYIYREGVNLVVKNGYTSDKDITELKKDIQEALERKKDGISLATIKGTVNACYDLSEENGVIIGTEEEAHEKFFYVRLPILELWKENGDG